MYVSLHLQSKKFKTTFIAIYIQRLRHKKKKQEIKTVQKSNITYASAANASSGCSTRNHQSKDAKYRRGLHAQFVCSSLLYTSATTATDAAPFP